tara:strand:+ start:507 stop:686 length:180 start_codon:yes stop_codon:yes gene_type:complete
MTIKTYTNVLPKCGDKMAKLILENDDALDVLQADLVTQQINGYVEEAETTAEMIQDYHK